MGLDMFLFDRQEREIAYWRKANQVHRWFVDHVQGGVDDCGMYPVTRDQLRELRETCQRVLDSSPLVDGAVVNGYSMGPGDPGTRPNFEDGKVMANTTVAEELLPTRSGFFFGGTDYDQYYVAALRSTVEQIDAALAMPEDVEFTYHSSW